MYTELRRLHGELTRAGVDEMEAASTKLRVAWSDDAGNVNEAYNSGFGPVKASYDNEFKDTLAKLEAIATAVEESMGSAFGADARIADGFGAI
ncbi:hypothetical protein [Nocardia sp. NPDC058666]|uniref:hypothetical protein n=1 Tax=unclassified Nocardia TaxID=2637762 RepID=UPI003650593C